MLTWTLSMWDLSIVLALNYSSGSHNRPSQMLAPPILQTLSIKQAPLYLPDP